MFPQRMGMCDDLSRLVCGVSKLRSDDPAFKSLPFGSRCCKLCDSWAEECICHFLMLCSFFEETRRAMYTEISKIPYKGRVITQNKPDVVKYLLGKCIQDVEYKDMLRLWTISGEFISQMYRLVLKKRRESDLISPC